MQIKFLSDLHIDQDSKDNPFELENRDIFTIIAGDISRSPEKTKDWIKKNLTSGIFIAGNHAFPDDKYSLQEVYSFYKDEFPLSGDISFLQNNYKIIENKVFIGCTLWTDFSLNIQGDLNYLHNKKISNVITGNYQEEDGRKVKLTPFHTIKEFKKSINYIDYISKKFPDKDIIVISHHCPSIKCSAIKYLSNPLNPMMITDLENFIKEHINIKYWFCGHCHRDPLNVNINQCNLIMNTRGYLKFKECPNFNSNYIIEI